METEWYVIDTRTDTIINCITTTGPRPELDPKRWISAKYLRLTASPTIDQLRQYQYWEERP